MVSHDEQDKSTSRRTYLRTAGTAAGAIALASGTALAGCDDKDDEVDGVEPEDDRDVVEEVEEDREPTEIDEPTAITESGNYILTDDIEVESGSGIRIITDNVSLNGDGHTISGDGQSSGLVVFGDVLRNVLVRDLIIEDFRTGVSIQELFESRINNVSVRRCQNRGISLLDSRRNTISNCELSECNLFFGTDAIENTVRNNTITDSPEEGIRIQDLVETHLVDNRVTGSDRSGLRARFTSNNIITQNEFENNGEFGIELEGADDNMITDNELGDNQEGPCNLENAENNLFRGNNPECDSEN